MADLTEVVNYDDGVYQLETTDPVQGGASGVSNKPGKNLANRTAWLKQAIDAILGTLATLKSGAFHDAGTAPGNVLLLDGSGKIPAVDGSQLTNVAGGLGYGQSNTDVHASRARNSTYQNTTAKPIWVSISLSFDASFSASALVGPASPPTVVAATATGSLSSGTVSTHLAFLVPPNHYYKFTSDIAPQAILGWAEVR